MKINHNYFLNLAFNIAKINLGKTNSNPSVGCVVVKDGSVISSGCTSINGRPHAEQNALNFSRNFYNSALYVTLEPCTHYGKTPPCAKIISKKKIKKVFFSHHDNDQRTSKKSAKVLALKKIDVYQKKSKNFKNFYKSYYHIGESEIPYIDAKIAFSKDFFSINKKSKWITNSLSRKRGHLLRSQYDSIISTSKSINKDNSLLNCRLDGLNNKKPDLIIIDLKLKLRKDLKLFKRTHKRNISIVTSISNSRKARFFKNKGIDIILIKSLKTKEDFIELLKILKKKRKYRILIESGLSFLSAMILNKLVYSLYLFKSSSNLNRDGQNNISNKIFKTLRLNNLINVNLKNDKLYKIKIK